MDEFKRQLEYKTEKFSSQLILVDRCFPSAQICSNCGNHRHKMPLKKRIYICPECGYIEDRDLNAAKNIDRSHSKTTVKQEVNSEIAHVKLMRLLG